MNEVPFNNLTPSQVELLAKLIQELGEVQVAVSNVLLHGYSSKHPAELTGPDNRLRLEMELGDVYEAVQLLTNTGELSASNIEKFKQMKHHKQNRYFHHQ